jgi:ATP-dependent RNA helicase DeaD
MIQFNEMGLDAPILKAIAELGFTEPTPIQEKVIPHLAESKKDLIALAQTGTGKTAAFGIPMIQNADMTMKDVQGIILCPTRELCMQISNDLEAYSKYTDGFRVVPVYGGAPIDKQIQKLKRGAQIVVGTPGRTRDLIERKILKIKNIKWVVLDEADEMLQMGFKDELDAILEGTPSEKQTFLFSATMPKGVYRIANEYMDKPEEISVGTKNAGAENVEHNYYMAHAKNRYEVLKRIADMNPDIYGIVFCRTRQETKDVAEKFMNDGYNADALHGDLSQAQRDYVMGRFRKKHLQMLVATDVAARGLDVNDLTHVINYNLPDDLEAYIHRSGRTGRAGKSGTSISIIHTRENGKIRELESISKKKFNRVQIPGGKEICKKQLFNLVENMEKVEAGKLIDEFLPEIYEKLETVSKEELIKKFVSVEFNRFLDYYKNAPDLNVEADKRGDRNNRSLSRGERSSSRSDSRGERSSSRSDSRGERSSNRSDSRSDSRGESRGDSKYSRFYINLGSKHDVNPTKLIGILLDTTNDRQINVGKIDIMKGFSFFEVEKQFEPVVLSSFSRNIMHDETVVKVEVSDEKPRGDSRKGSWEAGKGGSYSGQKKKDGYRSDNNYKKNDKKKHRKGPKY